MIYEIAKDIYIAISKQLAEGETIKFDVVSGCSTAYLLEEGCKAMELPPMTIVIYKPRLIWDTQHRVLMSLKDKNIEMALLIYDELYEGNDYKVVPERFLGNMETISYDMFNATYN